MNVCLCSKKTSVACKEKGNYLVWFCKIVHNFINFIISSNQVNIIRETFTFNALSYYICFPFLPCIKFCRGCFRQVFFHFGRQKKWLLVMLDRWSSYTVTIIWEFAWADSALVILDEWSSYRGGHLSRFYCKSCLSN